MEIDGWRKRHTINPRVNNDLCTLRQFQLGNLSLYTRILQRNLLHSKDLLAITRRMHIRPQPNIILNALS